jgi:hypothetical protein
MLGMNTFDHLQDTVVRMSREGIAPSDIMKALGLPQTEFYEWFGKLVQSGALDEMPKSASSAADNGRHERAQADPAFDGERLSRQLSEQNAMFAQFQKAATDTLVDQYADIRERLDHLCQQDDKRDQVQTTALGKMIARLQGEVPASVILKMMRRGFAVGVVSILLALGIPFALDPVGTLEVAYDVWKIGDQVVAWIIRLF